MTEQVISDDLWKEIKKISGEQPVNQYESAYETASKHKRIMELLYKASKI